MEDGEWRMENGEWRMENLELRTPSRAHIALPHIVSSQFPIPHSALSLGLYPHCEFSVPHSPFYVVVGALPSL
jgi:hypothetical protein